MKIKRTTINFVIDAVAFVAFVLLTATGMVERYLLPPGTGRFQSLWQMDRHRWGDVHYWIAVVLMGALAAHICLHWKWITSVVRGRPSDASGWRMALGVVGLVGLVGLSLSPFLAEVQQTGVPGRRQHLETPGEPDSNQVGGLTADDLRGSMSFAEIEQATGVSATLILRELGLPEDVPRDTNLGQIRRQYGFEMDDVRRVVGQHLPSK